MRTTVRRLCGHVSGTPRGVADQSWARIRAPISPPPDRNSGISPFSTFRLTRIALSTPKPMVPLTILALAHHGLGNVEQLPSGRSKFPTEPWRFNSSASALFPLGNRKFRSHAQGASRQRPREVKRLTRSPRRRPSVFYNDEAQCLSALEIDHQFELGGRLDGKLTGLGAPQPRVRPNPVLQARTFFVWRRYPTP